MRTRVFAQQDGDTTLWGGAALILIIASTDLWVQALVGILFPSIGWTLLYFIKREITYRFPPKERKALRDENLDKP